MATGTTRTRAKATPAAEPEAKATKAETMHQLKNRLRSEAEREVLQQHKDEVVKRTQAKFDEHGIEYVRRLTPEEKAQKEIDALLKQFPNLQTQVMATLGQQAAPVEEEGPDYNEIPDEAAYYAEAQVLPEGFGRPEA